MTHEQQSLILEFHSALPEGCRSKPATAEELAAFEKDHGLIPPDYRWYLATCGGGVVGSEWVDDIRKLKATHKKFREEEWTMKEVFPIGWDGGGNPMAIERSSGRLLVEDHDFGGIHELATSFAVFVLQKK